MLKTLLQEKTTALLAITAMLCMTLLMALGKMTFDQLEGALKYIFGTPVVASILNKLQNSVPSNLVTGIGIDGHSDTPAVP